MTFESLEISTNRTMGSKFKHGKIKIILFHKYLPLYNDAIDDKNNSDVHSYIPLPKYNKNAFYFCK